MGNAFGSAPYETAFRVADFLDVPLCAELLLLSKDTPIKSFGENKTAWFRYVCSRFREEFDLFVPGPLDGEKPPLFEDWPEFAQRFYQMRKRMSATEGDENEVMGEFQIGVLCRLTSRKIAPAEEACEREVVLPLYQRVALLRERYPQLSSTDALRAIMAERGRPALEDHYCDAAVKVKTVDAAPVDEAQKAEPKVAQQASILSASDRSILAVAPGIGLQNFEVDRVFQDMASQEDVYRSDVQQVVYDFVNGVNGCIICYGQTGSGKTYTMFGPPELPTCSTSPYRGIAPRAFEDIFKARANSNSTTSVSYVEIYGNAICDLFNKGQIVGQSREGRFERTRATDRVGHRYVLDGDTAVEVNSLHAIEVLLRDASQFKRQAATAMNDRSTRAHSVIVVHLSTITREGAKIVSRLFLADLGGSERIGRSKAGADIKSLVAVVGNEEVQRLKFAEYYQRRERIQETMFINQGLFTLKKVIKALLVKRDENLPDMRVPYFDNKLTMLLAPGLGDAASRTVVICCLSMDPESGYESLQTLRFAEACRNVATLAKGNDSYMLRAALEKIEEEIAELEQSILQKERWEEVREARVDIDTLAGEFGEEVEKIHREEIVVKTVLVGAEKEREMLETLLLRRRTMLGLDSLGKEFREKMEQQADGGMGQDFRETSFSKKMKAKDFEDLMLLADSLRFLFRKTQVAQKMCGETEETMRKKHKRENIPQQYHKWACILRDNYDNCDEKKVNFGKSMMDQCMTWSKMDRESAAEMLLKLTNTSVSNAAANQALTDCEQTSR